MTAARTLDDHGNLHDAAGRFAVQPGGVPGFDLAPAPSPIERFRAVAGRRATVPITDLGFLAVHSAEQGRLGGGSFQYAHEAIEVAPDDPVVVRQARVKVAQVLAYVEAFERGNLIEPIVVTDRPGDGRMWHLDGAHRLIAARLVGAPIEARIWR